MKIEINNINIYQTKQIVQFLKVMRHLGSIGASRWLCFYADGDGSFRPKIRVDNINLQDIKENIGNGKWERGKEFIGEVYIVDCDG